MTSPSSASSDSPTACASCGTLASGRYCANCGAALAGAPCASCSAELSPGAKFCHRCGAPTGGASPPRESGESRTNSLPWIVAALAFLALFAMAAGRGFNAKPSNTIDGSANALPQAGLDDRGGDAAGQAAGIRAPDISSLSPQERADRLYNRVMLLATQGKIDSVQFFAPMALTSYQMLSPLNADQRYDMGRIGEVAGALPLAKAQADSILLENPNHLLGLILEARIAVLSGDSTQLHSYERRLLAAEKAELAKKREEYSRHQDDITNALQQARKSLAGKS